MPRSRSPNRDKAREMYLSANGDIKLKDIAEELGVLDTQIRKWKNQDKWDDELKGTLPKEKPKMKSNVTNKKRVKKEQVSEEVEEVLNNTELTDKQRLFCIYYIKCFNASKAALKAGYSKDTAGEQGYQLLQKTSIRNEIERLKQHKLNRAMLSEDDIFQKYIDIAFADITDYVEFGQEEVPIMTMYGPLVDKETGEEITKVVNTVKFKESRSVDGTLISEVKQGKDGASIKLQDKMKALQWLSDRLDLLTIETREKIRMENAKLEIAKIKAGTNEDDEIEDDGFIEALQKTVSEVEWSDEEIN